MTQDDLYKAWHAVGADIAGLNFSDFVRYLPAHRTWVGLTDDEFNEISSKHSVATIKTFVQEIELKLKEKNT